MSNKRIPTEITLHKQQRSLEIAFDDGSRFDLPCEYLRVNSPSAEVQGHGPGQVFLRPTFYLQRHARAPSNR